jgi:hypothetical protein
MEVDAVDEKSCGGVIKNIQAVRITKEDGIKATCECMYAQQLLANLG